MRSGGKDFNYFKLTKLANFVQFKVCLCFVWRIGGLGPLGNATAPPGTLSWTPFKYDVTNI